MSLSRQLEPEVMDTFEEAADYDAMDHAAVNQVFVDDLLATGGGQGDILDLGTGTAQIPIRLCLASDTCRVMAVDLAEQMLNFARNNIEIAALTHRIQLDRVDAKSLPYDADQFDEVVGNSIVHHLPEPATCLQEAVRVVRPGGLLFFRDLLRPDDEPTLNHLVAQYAGEANDHQRQMFADSLRAALTLDEVRSLVGGMGFSAETVAATSDRHWTWSARK